VGVPRSRTAIQSDAFAADPTMIGFLLEKGTTDREIVAYDPAWPARFAELGRELRNGLGEVALRIDHIGSTSVPGLAAKPIIDIQISVADFEPLAAYRQPLERLIQKVVVQGRGAVQDHGGDGLSDDPAQEPAILSANPHRRLSRSHRAVGGSGRTTGGSSPFGAARLPSR
jgi:GrpB-like predicted nucleotidyltransferase (UPF0157 family)